MSTELEIDLTKTPEENMHAMLMSTAITEIPMAEYDLEAPVVYTQPGNNYLNTSVVIKSTTETRRGSDTHYYHRVDVGNRGFDSPKTPGLNIIARLFNIGINEIEKIKNKYPDITEPLEAVTKYISLELGLIHTEFKIVPWTGDSIITHVLEADPISYLYIGKLGIKIIDKDAGTLHSLMPTIFP